MSDFVGRLSEVLGYSVDGKVIETASAADCEIAVVEGEYRICAESQITITLTAFVVDSRELDLPQFRVRHTTRGMFQNSVDQIHIDGEVKFNGRFSLTGYAHEAIRRVFSPELCNAVFESNLFMTGVGRLLIVYAEKKLSSDQMYDRLKQVVEIVQFIRTGQAKLNASPEICRMTDSSAFVDLAKQPQSFLTSGIAKRILRVAIPQDQLDIFTNSDVPRSIPARLNRQVIGDNLGYLGLGVVLMVAGIVGCVAGFFVNAEFRWIIFASIPVAIVGAVVCWLTLQYRKNRWQCLTRGKLVVGRIDRIFRSGIVNGDLQRYDVRIEYELDGQTKKTRIPAYGGLVDVACYHRFAERPVNVLVDPQSHSALVCFELLYVSREGN